MTQGSDPCTNKKYISSAKVHMTSGATQTLTRLKKQLKGRHFSSDTEVIAAAETCLDGQPSEFVLSGL